MRNLRECGVCADLIDKYGLVAAQSFDLVGNQALLIGSEFEVARAEWQPAALDQQFVDL